MGSGTSSASGLASGRNPSGSRSCSAVKELEPRVSRVAGRGNDLGERAERLAQYRAGDLAQRVAPASVELGVVGLSRAQQRHGDAEGGDQPGDPESPEERGGAEAPRPRDRQRVRRQGEHHQANVLAREQRQRRPRRERSQPAGAQRLEGEQQRRRREALGVELEQVDVAHRGVKQPQGGEHDGGQRGIDLAHREPPNRPGSRGERHRLREQQRQRVARNEPYRSEQREHRREMSRHPRHAANGLVKRSAKHLRFGVREDRQVEVGVEVVAVLEGRDRAEEDRVRSHEREHHRAPPALEKRLERSESRRPGRHGRAAGRLAAPLRPHGHREVIRGRRAAGTRSLEVNHQPRREQASRSARAGIGTMRAESSAPTATMVMRREMNVSVRGQLGLHVSHHEVGEPGAARRDRELGLRARDAGPDGPARDRAVRVAGG